MQVNTIKKIYLSASLSLVTFCFTYPMHIPDYLYDLETYHEQKITVIQQIEQESPTPPQESQDSSVTPPIDSVSNNITTPVLPIKADTYIQSYYPNKLSYILGFGLLGCICAWSLIAWHKKSKPIKA